MRKTASVIFHSLLLLLAATFPATADTQPLTPFKATYKVITEGSVSLKGEGIRTLQQDKDGQWIFSSNASALFARINESSRFTLSGQQITPSEYLYSRKVLGKTRKAKLSFDWSSNTVINDVNDKPWTMNISPGVMDKLSYQLQLQQDLARGADTFSYRIADGGHLKEYAFNIIGQEEIDTPAGRFNAVHAQRIYDPAKKERSTHIWFAPALNYQLIKFLQEEDDGKTFSLLLTDYKQL